MSAAEDAFDIASMTQWKEGREAAMAVASGVAEAFRPDATVESVIEASVSYCGPVVRRAIERAIEIARKYNSPVDVIPEYYEKVLVEDGWSAPVKNDPDVRKRIATSKWSFACHPLELVPVGFGMFFVAKGNPMEGMIGATNFGRDCDGIAGFAGCLGAAMRGSQSLDLKMVTKVEQAAKASLWDMAKQLHVSVLKVAAQKERTVRQLHWLEER
jgi:ADP-ribosylglycohydrolase